MTSTSNDSAGDAPIYSDSSSKKRKLSTSSTEDSNGKKLKMDSNSDGNQISMSQLPSLPRQLDLPAFNLTSTSRPSAEAQLKEDEENSSAGWQKVDRSRDKKREKRTPNKHSANYPAIEFSKDARLQAQVKISDLQNLVLYILADGQGPQFVSVRHRPEIRKVVVLMVPGLEKSMFEKKDNARESGNDQKSCEGVGHSYSSPDAYYPKKLVAEELPEPLQPFAEMFKHLWPVKTPGDERAGKMHSPLHAMLTAPLPKEKEDKSRDKNKKGARPAKAPPGWKNTRTPITEFIHTPEELLENEYVVHPASYSDDSEKHAWTAQRQSTGVSKEHGWVDTLVNHLNDGTVPDSEIEKGSLTCGREVLAMDCEMCMTGEKEFSLTRISIVGWDGSVILDELVKPEKPIINYLTQYSGITSQMLAPVTTTLADIQEKLLEILHPRTILIGHSLNSDLTALKITHPYILDTALLYPHPRGPPLKSSLKWLAQRYLSREIQKGHGTTGPGAGHDSIEDAKTCLDLVKQKCEKGREWGTGDAAGENIFKRIARAGVRYKNQGGSAVPSSLTGKSSAAVDWGDPKKGPGAAASFQIGCHSDDEVVRGVIRAVKGDPDGKEIPGGGVDFVWGRLRELEALKGWWNNNKLGGEPTNNPLLIPNLAHVVEKDTTVKTSTVTSSGFPPGIDSDKSIDAATADLTRHLQEIHDALPPCTAFILYTGSGDPCEMSRFSNMQAQFKREYRVKKWDELSVKWTDKEEQAMKKATKLAREGGLGFVGIK